MSELNNERLISIVERIEQVNSEIDDLKEDRKSIMLEAKQAGFDTKALAHVIKQRKKTEQQREEESDLFAIYEHAVGL